MTVPEIAATSTLVILVVAAVFDGLGLRPFKRLRSPFRMG